MIEQLLFYIAVVLTIDLTITMFYTIKDLSKDKNDDNSYQ
jgi:hypothetical protein